MSEDTHQLYKEAQPPAGLKMAYASAWTQPRKALVCGRAVEKSTTLAQRLMSAQNAMAFARESGVDIGEKLEVEMARAIRIDVANRDAYFLEGLHDLRRIHGPLQRHHMPLVRAMAKVIEDLPVHTMARIDTIIPNAEKKDRSLAGRGAHAVCHDDYGPNRGGDAFP